MVIRAKETQTMQLENKHNHKIISRKEREEQVKRIQNLNEFKRE